jgi:hypothetical protein
MNHSHHEPRARNRDDGLARLRRATRVAFFGATALAGAFAGLAAHSAPGHKARAAAATTAQVRTRTQARTQVETQAQTQPQVTAPAPTPVPPVAVTGTS